MADETVNALISAQKASDSGLQIVLHPLPVLEISDFITRGYQRGFKGAVVGILMGQQNGREITIEHSFTCSTKKNDQGLYELDESWFLKRLDAIRQVHKDPQLDLVGWYALAPKTGPTSLHLPIHRQILKQNESAVLLGFHIEDVLRPATGDPLPLTIYESNLEADDDTNDSSAPESEDKEMKDSAEASAPSKMVLKFRELPYTTETGDAEMIAMQFIREGGTNAGTTLDDTEKRILEQFDKKIAVDDGKGKRRAVAEEKKNKKTTTSPLSSSEPSASAAAKPSNKDANLTRSESEYVSALQAKYNAIKMMKSRIDLVVSYLERLPPDFVSGSQTSAQAAASAPGGRFASPSNNILRQIQALVTNVELATPARQNTLAKEILQETNDVNLISLISDLVASVGDVREVGKKFAVVESARNQKNRGGGGGGLPFELPRIGGDGVVVGDLA